jgi:hypothetical protein
VSIGFLRMPLLDLDIPVTHVRFVDGQIKVTAQVELPRDMTLREGMDIVLYGEDGRQIAMLQWDNHESSLLAGFHLVFLYAMTVEQSTNGTAPTL